MITALDRLHDSDALDDWLTIAQPGEWCVYHVGHLAPDRAKNHDLDMLAKAMLSAAGWHLYRPRPSKADDKKDDLEPRYVRSGTPTVALVQRRCKRGFEYLGVRL